MILAGALSQASISGAVSELTDKELNSYFHGIISSLPISQQKLNQIADETAKDDKCCNLLQLIQNG